MNWRSIPRHATEDRYLGDDWLFGYCSQLAMGLRCCGRPTEAEQIAVWGRLARERPVGTAVDMHAWRKTGRPQSWISCGAGSPPPSRTPGTRRSRERQVHAMLCGDIKGFGSLGDAELPRFVETVPGALARVVERYGAAVRLSDSSGDRIFLVFAEAGKAARCALDLQAAMAAIDLAQAGLPPRLALRIGGHLGPVYATHDPILGRQKFFGADVSRVARIEPVTPEGFVYVTETLAAVLAIDHADELECDYVGMTEAAKKHGAMRMFLLRRRSPTIHERER